MKFEHLVEINDLSNPLIPTIERSQLWRGLVLRAESPQMFMPYIDECEIKQVHDQQLQRRLRFGELNVVDTVHFKNMEFVLYQVAAQGEMPESSLCMQIEEPEPLRLFVRFTYTDQHSAEEDAANEMLDDYRRSAYHEADVDTIRIIRELAEQGRLDALPS